GGGNRPDWNRPGGWDNVANRPGWGDRPRPGGLVGNNNIFNQTNYNNTVNAAVVNRPGYGGWGGYGSGYGYGGYGYGAPNYYGNAYGNWYTGTWGGMNYPSIWNANAA